MSKGRRLRAICCAPGAITAGLALTSTAGASGGRAIQGQDACDPDTFPAGLCARPDDSGPRVTVDQVFADLAKTGEQGQAVHAGRAQGAPRRGRHGLDGPQR